MYQIWAYGEFQPKKFRTLNRVISEAEKYHETFQIVHDDEGEVAYRVKGQPTKILVNQKTNKEYQDEP